ncbi:hypothetical protein BDR26DRAFT_851286 [Obelidium mucronatum]|nr:hypothetical protein BDR26DRAFT_851286 [Obelidium mucronatum]
MTRKKASRELWLRPIPCTACKRARKKCSLGREPGCSRCVKNGFPCEYSCAPVQHDMTKASPRKSSKRELEMEPDELVPSMGADSWRVDSWPAVTHCNSAVCSPSLSTPSMDSYVLEQSLLDMVFPTGSETCAADNSSSEFFPDTSTSTPTFGDGTLSVLDHLMYSFEQNFLQFDDLASSSLIEE